MIRSKWHVTHACSYVTTCNLWMFQRHSVLPVTSWWMNWGKRVSWTSQCTLNFILMPFCWLMIIFLEKKRILYSWTYQELVLLMTRLCYGVSSSYELSFFSNMVVYMVYVFSFHIFCSFFSRICSFLIFFFQSILSWRHMGSRLGGPWSQLRHWCWTEPEC